VGGGREKLQQMTPTDLLVGRDEVYNGAKEFRRRILDRMQKISKDTEVN
jgi:hypothetical protein